MGILNTDTGLSSDSELAINRLYDKKNQQRLAGMTSSDASELTGDVANVIKQDVRNKALLQKSAIGSELASEELNVRREGLNAQRLTSMEELGEQQNRWGTGMSVNERRYNEQMKDMKEQRLIGNITTGVSALGTGLGVTYKNEWGDVLKSWFSGFLNKDRNTEYVSKVPEYKYGTGSTPTKYNFSGGA